VNKEMDFLSFFDKKMKQYAKKTSDTIINPIEIFKKSLIQKPTYDFLRENQTDFLKQWHSRRDERDIVGVMDTGSGKTLIGLLMLYSKIQEGEGPSVYLCPDKQLVQQVCDQASLYGIPVCEIAKTENFQDFPLEFINCKSVLVTTFEKLFNGKSIFGVKGNTRPVQDIGALLIDDAHECVKKARDKASIKIHKSKNRDLYENIVNLFNDDLEYQGRAAFNSIKRGEASVIQQVAYWSWNNKLATVIDLLEKNNNSGNPNIFFNYNLVLDDLEICECFISGKSIEITPLLIPVDKIPSFDKAKHRYILSATLNNGFSLISDLGIEEKAIKNPIKVETNSLGERLVLAPKRYNNNITDDEIRNLCLEYSKNYNVVVIVPSNPKAEIWTQKGARLIDSNNILEEVQKLKKEKCGNLIVISNRYDGMDLIDDSCRMLVLDGMPTKESFKEKIEMQYRENSLFVNMKRAQAIEQGLGRGVRSGTDHCVANINGKRFIKFYW
jgi:hypothetical protein